jgi:hypothetical protein
MNMLVSATACAWLRAAASPPGAAIARRAAPSTALAVAVTGFIAAARKLASLGAQALLGSGLLPLCLHRLLLAQLGLAGQELGLLTLLTGLRPALLGLVLPRLLGLGEARFHLLGDALHLLLAQRALHGRKEVLALVARMLAERLLQFGETLREGRLVLRNAVELGDLRAQLLVLADRVRDQALRLGIAPENREEVLFLEAGVELKFRLQLGEELLPCLHGTVRCLGQLCEELVGLGGTGLHEGSEGHGSILAMFLVQVRPGLRTGLEGAAPPNGRRKNASEE